MVASPEYITERRLAIPNHIYHVIVVSDRVLINKVFRIVLAVRLFLNCQHLEGYGDGIR